MMNTDTTAPTKLTSPVIFKDRLHQAMANVRRGQNSIALIHISLSGLQAINDTVDDKQNNKVLTDLEDSICDLIRETDSISPLNGDEFIVLLTDLSHQDGCELTLWRILAGATTSIDLNNEQANITASIGVSVFGNQGTETDTELLQQAKSAMEDAKNSDHNCFRFFDGRHIG